MIRSWALAFSGFALALGVAEGVAQLRVAPTAERIAEREHFLRLQPHPANGFTEGGAWESSSLALHPFFGYVGRGFVNRFGFFGVHDITLRNERLTVPDADIVVGLFGGSLAGQVAGNVTDIEKMLAPLFPGKRVAFLSFALPGHAMPQAYFIYAYFREVVNVAIFLDGLNEIWNPVVNNQSGVPPVFAKAAHYRALSAGDPRPRIVHERLARYTRASLWAAWRRSALAHLAWAAYRQYAMRELAGLDEPEEFSPFFRVSEKEILGVGARNWEDYHRMAESLARSRGTLTVHALQPTLLYGGKPLTGKEQAIAVEYSALARLVGESYPGLRARLAALKRDRFAVADLTEIFAREPEEMWIDAAHVNERGRERLVRAIVQAVDVAHRERGRRREATPAAATAR